MSEPTFISIPRKPFMKAAFAVRVGETFIGYVTTDGTGWSAQAEEDPTVELLESYAFPYAYPSRDVVAAHLVAEATDAGVLS